MTTGIIRRNKGTDIVPRGECNMPGIPGPAVVGAEGTYISPFAGRISRRVEITIHPTRGHAEDLRDTLQTAVAPPESEIFQRTIRVDHQQVDVWCLVNRYPEPKPEKRVDEPRPAMKVVLVDHHRDGWTVRIGDRLILGEETGRIISSIPGGWDRTYDSRDEAIAAARDWPGCKLVLVLDRHEANETAPILDPRLEEPGWPRRYGRVPLDEWLRWWSEQGFSPSTA